MSTPVTQFSPAHMEAGINTLSAGFQDSLLYSFIEPDEQLRAQAAHDYFGVVLRYGLLYGEVRAVKEGAGVAVWLPPGQADLSLIGLARAGALPLALRMLGAFRRFLTFLNSMQQAHRIVMGHQPHSYLFFLGVHPDYQGQGLGSALLRDGLARVDAAGNPCYLETSNPLSVPLYERWGFYIAFAGHVPNGPKFWGMLRPSAAQKEKDHDGT